MRGRSAPGHDLESAPSPPPGHERMKTVPLDIDLPKLRGLLIDVEIGALNDPEKIRAEIKIWEAVRSWAALYRKSMDLVQELGDKIDRNSYFVTGIIGTETMDRWRTNPAALRAEKEKLIANLAEMDRLVAALLKVKH